MRNIIVCPNCGNEWEEAFNPVTHCPLCRRSLRKKVSPVNIQGDKPIAAHKSTTPKKGK